MDWMCVWMRCGAVQVRLAGANRQVSVAHSTQTRPLLNSQQAGGGDREGRAWGMRPSSHPAIHHRAIVPSTASTVDDARLGLERDAWRSAAQRIASHRIVQEDKTGY